MGLCLACGGTTEDDPAPGTEATAGSGAEAGSSSGGRGGAGGGSNTGGQAGDGAAGSAAGSGGAAGESSQAGAGGNDLAGAGGAGGEPAACNDLELVDMNPPCSALSVPPPATGGEILEGTYALAFWESALCLALEQTLRLTRTGADTFDVETAINFGEARANAEFVVSGTTLTSTPTCGNDEPPEVFDYSAYDDGGLDYLQLGNAQGVFTYQLVD